jgi:hypothetical protein
VLQILAVLQLQAMLQKPALIEIHLLLIARTGEAEHTSRSLSEMKLFIQGYVKHGTYRVSHGQRNGSRIALPLQVFLL